MMPNLVPKIEPDDRPSDSSVAMSINSLKAAVATDLDKLQKAYEDKIRTKCEEIAKLRTDFESELGDLKLEKDRCSSEKEFYSDKCKSLVRENSKQKGIIAEQKEEISALKAWSSYKKCKWN